MRTLYLVQVVRSRQNREKYPRLRKIFSGESVLKGLDLPRAWQIIENSSLLPTDRERLLFSILYGVWEGG